jgi:hypothetical protein
MGEKLGTVTSPTLQGTSPETLSGLLRALHIEHVSAHKQHDILKVWLGSHTPSPQLRISMRRNGFGDLLKSIHQRKAS